MDSTFICLFKFSVEFAFLNLQKIIFMQFSFFKFPIVVLSFFSLVACNNEADTEASASDTSRAITEKEIQYIFDGVTMNGLIVYNAHQKIKSPAVLVVHEWWGINDYSKSRARQLADLGYTAMAVDMYGGGQQADNPEKAQSLAKPFYDDPYLAYERLNAAINTLKKEEFVNPDQLAAIGYCYGGFVVLNAAKAGADLKGIVSFHGNLSGLPVKKDSLQAEILICHGGNDPFVPEEEVNSFKSQMDSAGIDYSFKVYPGATHAFTNPQATATGKQFEMPISYNQEADKKSWQDMKDFLSRLFY